MPHIDKNKQRFFTSLHFQSKLFFFISVDFELSDQQRVFTAEMTVPECSLAFLVSLMQLGDGADMLASTI